MKKLVLFIGPPSSPGLDRKAFDCFMTEKAEKVILGGTICSIFERYIEKKAIIHLETMSRKIPPYGYLDGMLVCEGSVTLKAFSEIYNKNVCPDNAAGVLKEIINRCDLTKIYRGTAINPKNGINKTKIFEGFIDSLRRAGKTPEVLYF